MMLSVALLLCISANAFAQYSINVNTRDIDGKKIPGGEISVTITNLATGATDPMPISNGGHGWYSGAFSTSYRIDYETLPPREPVTGSLFYKTPAGWSRRRRSLSGTLALIAPTLPIDQMFQVIMLWDNDASTARCNFDSILTVPYNNPSTGCRVDTHDSSAHGLAGYCTDAGSYAYAYHAGDSKCPSTNGYEIIDIYENGLGTYSPATYKHMIYAHNSGGSFTGSQAQVHVFRRNPITGATENFANAFIEDVSSFDSDHRFYHTLSFDINPITGVASSTAVNQVTCDPSQTTGSNATIAAEGTQARNC